MSDQSSNTNKNITTTTTTTTTTNKNSAALNTRNLAIIAHVDHGKTSVCDSLLAAGGQLASTKIGGCQLDNALAESAERGITIVASSVSLVFDVSETTLADGRRLALERMRALHLAPLTSVIDESEEDDLDDDADADADAGDQVYHVDGIPSSSDVDSLRVQLARALPSDVKFDLSPLRHNGTARLVVHGDVGGVGAASWFDTSSLAPLRVVVACGSVVARARQAALALGREPPSFVVTSSSSSTSTSFVCNNVIGATRREARQGAARALLLKFEEELYSSRLLPSIQSNQLNINLIDSPGHVDFSAEVSSALRLTDGAIVVADMVEGIAPQTISVLRQALRERVRVVLFLNKVDRGMGELQLDASALADKLAAVIDGVNAVLGDAQAPLSFGAGTVAFGSALEGWGVSLDSVCDLLAARGDVDVGAMRARLVANDANAFARLVLQPLYVVRNAVQSGDFDAAQRCLARVRRAASGGKALDAWRALVDANDRKNALRSAMRAMYPLADALVAMATRQLPSPCEAQRIRADVLYKIVDEKNIKENNNNESNSNNNNDDDDDDEKKENNKVECDVQRDDEALRAIRLCDADGPTMLFASKQIVIAGRSYSICRVFAGTVRIGDELIIHENDGLIRRAKVGGIVIPTARDPLRVDCARAGSIVAIAGIALTGGTATSSLNAGAFRSVATLVTPVVGLLLRVGPGAKGDARKRLIDAARQLAASDVALRIVQADGGGLLMRGVGELHLEISLSRLKTAAGIPIEASEPVVELRETCVRASLRACLGKSSNKHNRVYMMVEPVTVALQNDLTSATNDKERQTILLKHRFSIAESKRVLAFGGVGSMLIDRTQGISVQPIQDSLIQAFQQIVENGVLAQNQPMMGIAFILVDARFHADAKHRAPGDIVPAAVRAMSAAALSSELRLCEPTVQVDVNCARDVANVVYAALHRRGALCSAATNDANEKSFVQIGATMSVRQSMGLVGVLRHETKGQAFPTMQVGGWRQVNGSPFDVESEAAQIVGDARIRVGLTRTLPLASDFEDRL